MLLFLVVICPLNIVNMVETDNFFSHILTQVYRYNDVDLFIVCGDLNVRLGSLNDTINTVDKLVSRNIIDNTKNKHGESLQEFL